MAKRYVQFDRIPEGNFKPEGTLGRHHCTVVRQGDEKVVVGSVAGRVTLKSGDTLGYDCGTVWVVPRAESYRDPIRRVLAQAHLSQKLLEYSAEPVEFTNSWQDTSGWPENSAADPSAGEEATVFGANDRENLESWDHERCYRVTGGDAIVVRQVVSRETTTYRPRRVTRVVVRPTANKAAVVEWLFEEVVPEGRERRIERENRKRFLTSMKDLLASQGMEIPSDDELARIGDLHKAVADNRYRQKEMIFEGVGHRLSWHGHTSYVDRFFWERGADAPQINFVSALRSGLLEAWVTRATVV
jgi:hypothetical protein